MDHVSLKTTDNMLQITGIVYYNNVVELRALGEKAILAGADSMQVDLAGVQKMDSSIASLLCCWLRYAKLKQKMLVFKHPSQDLLNLLNLYGIKNMIMPSET